MPIDYRIDSNLGLLHGRATGAVDRTAILSYINQTLADPANKQVHRELIDLRSVSDVRVNSADLRAVVAYNEQFAAQVGQVKTAILAPRDLAFGLARMYEILSQADYPHVEVFRTLEEALAYLELPPDWNPDTRA